MKKFKAAIFDMDGTLLDTMYIWRHLAPAYLERNNIAVPDDLVDKMTIMGIRRAVDFLIENFKLSITPDALLQELLDILADYYRYNAVFKPGTEAFLQALKERGIATVVFSATPQHLIKMALERQNAVDYFSHGLLSCESVGFTKNKPEAFMAVARYLNVEKEEVMVFEDAWYAASTAKAGGFPLCVMADEQEYRTGEMRELADIYIEKSWDEFPVDRWF